MASFLDDLIQCPQCSGSLLERPAEPLVCQSCRAEFSKADGIYNLIASSGPELHVLSKESQKRSLRVTK